MKKFIINTFNDDVDKNAYMNWRLNHHEPIQNMIVMADGYMTSVIVNAKSCLENTFDKTADILIFPMFFSLNQGIELYLKSICWSLNILLNYKSKYGKNHDIRNIWFLVKNKINEFGFNEERPEDSFNKMVKNIEPYLNELANYLKKDNINDYHHNIDFSRYPVNNRDEYHFFVNQFDNVTVDLEVIKKFATQINGDLKCLTDYYYGLVVESW